MTVTKAFRIIKRVATAAGFHCNRSPEKVIGDWYMCVVESAPIENGQIVAAAVSLSGLDIGRKNPFITEDTLQQMVETRANNVIETLREAIRIGPPANGVQVSQ